ncbi:hypothetical protein A2348_01485 [Candidatus Uhrbacteria bacterium RIFOXYB12_FULL_58_10]|uniref:Radical SAM core domain-containing protein n=1 Tax=Candidatus Uhrbacteria bacterium RIFOXYB2_FULL_57_15 TaxID=1802422 RepID=A0A1F7W5G1_9BACT|nr:MAG: hypothetical protein A2348_01485 [Candidatus Uhrbacteria bacterium RIFOXYB12_FULL_58_10]OGL98055.1 MAG: hypothetical protein A2304_00915 [Candidatus Uhrbacteria bacterium RIFOXYB2_FULL_57_15]OGL99734.1 MAG: hypothetical protein A2501_00255 [Candidatus Uhrbacteria bacterium RIFOXYC12_FULL_57_11]
MDTQKPQIAHGNGQMRAQSISLMCSSRTRCNAGCRFCISRTTPEAEVTPCNAGDIAFCNERRLRVGLRYAERLGATHAILTGKADPTQETPEYLTWLVSTAQEYLPLVDMHTNGWLLHTGKLREQLLEQLVDAGLTMVSFSLASFDEAQNRELMGIRKSAAELIPIARDLGLLVRCSLVMSDLGVKDAAGVLDYVQRAGNLGAHQVVVREVWRPKVYGAWNAGVYEWSHAHAVEVAPIQDEFIRMASELENQYGLQQRDPLPWGTPVFVVGGNFKDPAHGVNLTFSCTEEGTSGSVLKSIVHKPDGHGYRNWDHNGESLY